MAQPSETPSLNGEFLEALYEAWAANPASVDPSWAAYFKAYPETFPPRTGGPSWTPKPPTPAQTKETGAPLAPTDEAMRHLLWGSIRALRLIRAYRARGHFAANLDPLGIEGGRTHPELDPAFYGFAAEDMDQTFVLDGSLGLENKLDLRIRGKGLKFSDIDTIYVHSYIKGSKLGVLSKSDTLKLTRYLCAFLADDTVYYSIYTSNIIDEPLDNKYYYRLQSEFDYILKIPKISNAGFVKP
ncbi:MAG: hypothetical protein LCH26_06040 [Proteobacteria bacterium]|nr:hypothetical protein [Pseudomonadota bacterium]